MDRTTTRYRSDSVPLGEDETQTRSRRTDITMNMEALKCVNKLDELHFPIAVMRLASRR
jgi:hypothetical protein